MSATRLSRFCAGDPEVMTWLREHDLDPHRVGLSESKGPFIDGDRMTVHLYLEDGDGRRYFDPNAGDVATEVCTIALLRPPPDLRLSDGTPFPATTTA